MKRGSSDRICGEASLFCVRVRMWLLCLSWGCTESCPFISPRPCTRIHRRSLVPSSPSCQHARAGNVAGAAVEAKEGGKEGCWAPRGVPLVERTKRMQNRTSTEGTIMSKRVPIVRGRSNTGGRAHELNARVRWRRVCGGGITECDTRARGMRGSCTPPLRPEPLYTPLLEFARWPLGRTSMSVSSRSLLHPFANRLNSSRSASRVRACIPHLRQTYPLFKHTHTQMRAPTRTSCFLLTCLIIQ